eukprot:m.73423 g.73423  ORF g.73423 m.73423 type:complete len:214 (-) comp17029_c0_seq5:107-748(-)
MNGDCDVCAICLEDLPEQPQQRAVTGCNHTFCHLCFLRLCTQPAYVQACPLCRAPMSLFTLRNGAGEPALQHNSTPRGLVFYQNGLPGVAAYHFDEDTPYISYANAPNTWRTRDGTKVPERKEFVDFSFHDHEFRGKIVWGENTLGGDAEWHYVIKFAPDFSRIVGGTIGKINIAGQRTGEHGYYPEDAAGLHYSLALDVWAGQVLRQLGVDA